MTDTSSRVRELIERSGVSQNAFAVEVGLDAPKLSKSLAGARRFTSLDLARIAERTGVTVDWLISGQETALAMAARSSGGPAARATREAQRFSSIRADVTSLGFPLEARPQPPAVGGTYEQQAETLATWANQLMYRTGSSTPRDDLTSAIENTFSVDVATAHLDGSFDGLAARSETTRCIVLAATPNASRQRFTLAHELCHLMTEDDQGIHLDEDIYAGARRREASELRANAFAAALLMPQAPLREAIGSSGLSQEAFAALACELWVSPSALAYRLKGLRLIDAGTCDRFKSLSMAKAAGIAGKTTELAILTSRSATPRPPGLLARDTLRAYESGAATLRPYANVLGIGVGQAREALEATGGSDGS